MRFKKYAECAAGLQPITTVPLANIVFLVFIFAGLCLGYLAAGTGINVELPRAITSSAIRGPAVHIVVLADGALSMNGQQLTLEQLQRFLKQISARGQTIVVNADSRVPWQNVIRVWDAVRSSGLQDCVVATHP